MNPLTRASLPLLLLLSGCGMIGLDPLGDSGTGEPVQIASITPDWGPPGGGTQVAITGKGFEGAVTVIFGRAAIGSALTVQDPENLVVTTPDAGMPMTVDVTVQSELGEAIVVGGYTYSDQEPKDTGDSGDTSDTSDTDDSGGEPWGTGGLLEIYYNVVACVDCFSDATEQEVFADALFHTPKAGHWTDWMPSVGTCVTDPGGAGLSSSFLDGGASVTLSAAARSIALRKQTDNSYENAAIAQENFISEGTYALSVPGGAGIDAMEIPAALEAPLASFTDLQPIAILEPNPYNAFAPVVSRGGQAFTWAPTSPSDYFEVVIVAYNSAGTSMLGATYCLGQDSGSLYVPAANLPWGAGSLLMVYVQRYKMGSFDIPATNSTGDWVSACGFLGTATLR